ncbi:MAG: 30S ribosomal protein S6, partial [Patescibacteria group bacterium]
KNNASTVHFAHHLDRKRLAYPIDTHTYGYYFLAEFEAEHTAISAIERELSLMNSVLRHSLAVKKTVGKPPVIERKQAFDALPAMEEVQPESLSEQPIISHTQQTQPVSAPVLPETPVVESSHEIAQPPETEPIPTVTLKTEPQEETPIKASEPEQSDAATAPKDRKKQTKLSYEELDKRLDEIINNDIF